MPGLVLAASVVPQCALTEYMSNSSESADTIIVGAGSAGAVIATRMTERSDRQVLLVEAGPDYATPEQIPADLRDGTRNSMTAHDWGWHYRPHPEQVPFEFPRGKVVGGSSAVNTCIALRGMPSDYDEWAALGLPEWSWQNCLPAFKRLENDLDYDNEWHSQSGPIPIRRHKADELVPWQAAFLEACGELGYQPCADHNDPTTTGYGPHAMNKVDGERMSALRCYLTPDVRARANLEIRADTLVRRVLFDGKRVRGIEVETKGEVSELRCKQLVLAAGAIATPAILLRSGVGPESKVRAMGVDPVHALDAVAERLLDHPGAAVVFAPRGELSHPAHPLIQTVLRYTSKDSPYRNDMQLQPGSIFPMPLATFPLVTMMCCVGKPRGHGTLEFESADPRSKPRIDMGFLTHPSDLERACEAMELAWLCASSSAMKDLIYYFWPSERVLRYRDEMREWIVTSCGSGYHPCGTVPMGIGPDRGAAVDGRGRAFGLEGLVVADASIMPTIPSSNTNLATLMIGERFGEWLRDDD